jgi:predicted nuclease of predicted toxin-antitoxin system
MRLLLDECVPLRLKQDLPGHDVYTVREKGWSSKRNGELLRLMRAEGFQCLLTVDQNLEFQQNLRESGVSVILIAARSNRLRDLKPAVPRVLDALSKIAPGEILRVST